MTIPYERTRAVVLTEDFLKELAFETKRLPKAVRERAKGLLRHYPTRYEMSKAAEMGEKCPDKFMEFPFGHPDEDFFGRKKIDIPKIPENLE